MSDRPLAPETTRYVTLAAAGAACGGFLFGYDTSTMNSAINGIRDTLDLGAGTVGFVTAIALIGAAIGAWFAGGVSERFGRTRVMLIAGGPTLIGSLGASLVSQVLLLGLFRVATGLGIGAASAVVPSYVTEISPTSIRGRLGTFWQFAIVFGQLLGLLAGYGLSRWAGDEAAAMPWGGAAWSWMFVVVALLAVIYVLVALRLPATPPDLVRLGHEDEARTMLSRVSDRPVGDALTSIKATLAKQSTTATLADLRGPRFGLQPIVWVGILLAAFQQLVGINIVKTYSNTLWQSVGVPAGASFTVSIVTVLISLASTIVAIAIMDKVGRRTLLTAGAAVMVPALGMMTVAFSTATGSGEDVRLSDGAGIVTLIGMNLFAVAFGITWGPVMWLMLGELFDSDLRTIAVAACTAVNWLTNWAITRSFPTLAEIGLSYAYGLYTLFALLAFFFAWRVLPETKDQAIE
jgi:SP family sugar:H+ symporter-like MFS transporter